MESVVTPENVHSAPAVALGAKPAVASATLGRLIVDTARMPYVALEDAQLYYEEHGAGDPLVLAHGFTGTGEASWTSSLPALAERYRVIAPDLRGHGLSTGAPETRHPHARFAADPVALLDHLDLERAHFVGHSAGALSLLILGTGHLPAHGR